MFRSLKYVLSIAFGLFLSSTFIFGQATGGAVTGTIVDANGAVIPSVTVKLADNARGQVFTTQTTGTGSYLYPNVPVGEYTISIEHTGFEKASKNVTVALNQTVTIDATLQVGGGANSVDVVAGGDALVQTDTSQVGKSFETRSVQDLPNAGNINSLAALAPNVLPNPVGLATGTPVIGGVRPRGNTFNVDGVDNDDPGVTGPVTAPIQDAVQEFTLLQNNFNAEFGAGAGGQFNTVTKSGTNQYHGSVFTYIDTQKLNASSTTEGTQGSKDFFKQARYGGTFGGPLPYFSFGDGDGPKFKSGKNNLFFFGAYERTFNEGAGSPAGTAFLPTQAGLSQIAAIAGVSPFVINILRNNVALATAADADATAEFGTVLGVSGIPFGPVALAIPNTSTNKAFQINIDHLPNERNQLRYRYSDSRFSAEQAGNGGLAFNNFNVFNTRLFSANWINTISSNIINDLRLSYRQAIADSPLVNTALADFPNIEVLSLNLSVGPSGNLPQSSTDYSYQVYDSLTVVHGAHTFKFGGEFRNVISSNNFLPRERGDYQYSNFDLLLRDFAPDNVNIRSTGSGAFVSSNYRLYGFVQDDWKVRSNLTLNLGVRHEYQSLPRDAALQQLNSISTVPGVIEFGVPKTDKNNIAPRLGFAWAPTWDTSVGRFLFGKQGDSSIRGNYSRAFFTNFSNLVLLNLPPQRQAELRFSGSGTQFLQNGGALKTFVPVTGQAESRAQTASIIEDQTVPYTNSFSVSYQRQLGKSMGIEFRYLNTRSYQLPVQIQLNGGVVKNSALIIPTLLAAPTPGQLAGLPSIAQILAANPTIGTGNLEQFGFNSAVTAFPNIGRAWYDGVSASLNRRFTKNFSFTTAYTFSKTLDDSTNELNTSALNPRRPENAGNRFDSNGLSLRNEKGLSALDIPHRFVTSFNVDLPFFDKSENAFLRMALGGFQVNGIFQIQSGQPITVRSGRDSNLNFDAAGDRAIFNSNGDPNISSGIFAVNSAGTRIRNANGVDVLDDPSTVAYVALNPNAGYI
ncbi:MAG: carboxypeptidase regulatory-like domain-containing protein, partial [Pyrinomonadaceae bacterium]